MDGTAAAGTRASWHVRWGTAVAVLVAAVVVLIPAPARGGTVSYATAHHPKGVAAVYGSDQHSSTLRLEQPQIGTTAPQHVGGGERGVAHSASASKVPTLHTAQTPRTRGPPTDDRNQRPVHLAS